jgi:hypothetical protein
MDIVTKITAFFMSIIAFFCSIFGIPYYPSGEELDISKFELTFEDDFDYLDYSVWSGHYCYGDVSTIRGGAYLNKYIPYVEDGNLIMPIKYLPDGMGGTGAGWYSSGLDTDDDVINGFSQCFGYFECRCILPKGVDVCGAFWMMNEGVFNVDGSGRDGTEIDIFESDRYGDIRNNAITSNLHYDGYDEAHQTMRAKKFLIRGNPYEEYNTYGVEWNEKEYIFYINRVETFRTSWGGVSQNPQYMILSNFLAGENAIPSGRENAPGEECQMIVDYVRAYQYKDLLNN